MFVYNANYNILILGTDSNLESHSIEISKAFSSIPHYNVYEEIEKRKTKFWYKRKFVLCFIKNRIKRINKKKFFI